MPACRGELRTALKERFSPKSAGAAALAWTCPSVLRSMLPPIAAADIPPPPIRRTAP
jgi:hypothetical protein